MIVTIFLLKNKIINKENNDKRCQFFVKFVTLTSKRFWNTVSILYNIVKII
jgi:hypothetical protein